MNVVNSVNSVQKTAMFVNAAKKHSKAVAGGVASSSIQVRAGRLSADLGGSQAGAGAS